MSRETLMIACVRLIMDDPDYDAIWLKRTTGWRTESGKVAINVLSVSRIGVDETRHADEGSDDVRERTYGNRTLRVQFTCESDDQSPESSGMEIAEVLGAGFMRSDVLALLEADDVGNPRPQTPIDVSYESDDTERSAAVIEIWFNASRIGAGPLVPIILAAEVSGEIEEVPDAVGPFTVEV